MFLYNKTSAFPGSIPRKYIEILLNMIPNILDHCMLLSFKIYLYFSSGFIFLLLLVHTLKMWQWECTKIVLVGQIKPPPSKATIQCFVKKKQANKQKNPPKLWETNEILITLLYKLLFSCNQEVKDFWRQIFFSMNVLNIHWCFYGFH